MPPPPTRRDLLRGGAALATLAALPGCGASDSGPAGGDGANVFRHGVASGDPLPDRVILWTRVSGSDSPTPVDWEVATDADFQTIVRRGGDGFDSDEPSEANAARDHTFKVDVGGLAPGTSYFYRFTALGRTSQVGRTKTAPAGSPDNLRLVFVTCGDFSRGLWNAYARVAERDDLDAVVHLGDYIYENDRDRVRTHQPPVELRSLEEYRGRYASYRAEPELQAVHAAHPMIWVWDDHETVDGTWMNGADPSNHDPEEDGPFELRKANALQAALEWLPIRSPDPAIPERIYRRFAFGDLIDLFMLDTRRIGRDKQGEPNFADALFTQTGEFADPERHILGPEQEQWLIDGLQGSTAKWRLLGNQVVFSQIKAVGAPNATGQSVYANPDQWDGYNPARNRIFDAIEGGDVDNLVILTCDVHLALAFEVSRDPNNAAVYTPRTGLGTLAVEFVAPSISSAGDPAGPEDVEGEGDIDNAIEGLAVQGFDALRAPNPHLQYTDERNGYLLLDVNRDRVQAEYWLVPTVTAETDEQSQDAVFTVPDGEARIAGVNPPSGSAGIQTEPAGRVFS